MLKRNSCLPSSSAAVGVVAVSEVRRSMLARAADFFTAAACTTFTCPFTFVCAFACSLLS